MGGVFFPWLVRFSRVIQFDCLFLFFFLFSFCSSDAVYCVRMFFGCIVLDLCSAKLKFYILLNNHKIQQNIAVELMQEV